MKTGVTSTPTRVLHLVGGKRFQGGTASVVRDLVKSSAPDVSNWIWVHRESPEEPGLRFVCSGLSRNVSASVLGDLAGSIRDISSVLRAIKGLSISILHAHSRLGIFVGWLAYRIRRVPLVVHFHFLAGHPWLYRLLIRTSNAAVIYNSRLTARHYGADTTHSNIVMPTLEWPRSDLSPSGESRVVSASALYPNKHVQSLIEAGSILATEGRTIEMVICGRAPDSEAKSYERKIITRFNNKPWLKFEEWRRDWTRILRGRDIFVHLGHPESFGLVILEAFARGLRLVVLPNTFVDDLPDEIRSRGIYRAQDLEAAAVASAISTAMCDEIDTLQLRDLRSKVAAEFSTEHIVNKITTIYRNLL